MPLFVRLWCNLEVLGSGQFISLGRWVKNMAWRASAAFESVSSGPLCSLVFPERPGAGKQSEVGLVSRLNAHGSLQTA
jgi:hypothetical protein